MQTVITTFEVNPGTCQDLIDELTAAYQGFIRDHPGFRSAALHVNDAQTRVAVLSRWGDREAFMDLLRDEKMRALSRRLNALCRTFEPVLYETLAEVSPR
ncbi:MAG: antibiotic biosynthesis monooxygenase [Paracoccaceae bacterium]